MGSHVEQSIIPFLVGGGDSYRNQAGAAFSQQKLGGRSTQRPGLQESKDSLRITLTVARSYLATFMPWWRFHYPLLGPG